MAKNRIMAQKNEKVKKCDAINRRERKLSHLSMQKLDARQNDSRLHENNDILLLVDEWKSMYEEVAI